MNPPFAAAPLLTVGTGVMTFRRTPVEVGAMLRDT